MSNEDREVLWSSAVGRRLSRRIGLAALAAAVMAAALPTVAADAPVRRAPFDVVPRRALVELKATIGREFSSGLVFVNGRYVEPPYKVERYGTALRVNGIQVTDEIIPWNDFLKTQSGVRIEKIEHPAAPAAPVPEPEPEPEVSVGGDLDDLFSDDPAPKRKPAARAPRRPSAPSAPPPPTINYILDGEFVPNDRTKAMVERINKLRTSVELSLRKGGCLFFGSRYPMVSIDRTPAEMFLGKIPDIMKSCTTYDSFVGEAHAKGLSYLSEPVLRDLFRNRLDYIRLQSRAKTVSDERRWENMLKTVR